ncbi:hypothetical protein D3C81_2263130 [compost metagenome]
MRNAQKRAHAELLHFFFAENFDFHTKLLKLFSFFSELDRTENVGWLIDEIACF